METLISGLVLAGASGLTLLAYRHPAGYKRISLILRVALPVCFVAAGIWDMSAMSMAADLIKVIPLDKIAEATTIKDGHLILSLWRFAGYAAVIVYLEFLVFLPDLLGEKEGT